MAVVVVVVWRWTLSAAEMVVMEMAEAASELQHSWLVSAPPSVVEENLRFTITDLLLSPLLCAWWCEPRWWMVDERVGSIMCGVLEEVDTAVVRGIDGSWDPVSISSSSSSSSPITMGLFIVPSSKGYS